MCELLGINFAEPVFVDYSIRSFAARDVENADGWGLAWYPDRSLSIAKEPLTWTQSEFADFLQTYAELHSSIYIGHIRKKTVGGPNTRADTHPFSRELNGREYCFAHNGTIYGAPSKLPSSRFTALGSTDSEQVMCHVLDQIAQRDGHLDSPDAWAWLHRMCASINLLGKFNCLMSDGVHLFAYHDVNTFKGLWMRSMVSRQHEWQHLDDPTLHVDVEAERGNRGVIIATRPLSSSGHWRRFRGGQMAVLTGGECVYSRATPPHQPRHRSGVEPSRLGPHDDRS